MSESLQTLITLRPGCDYCADDTLASLKKEAVAWFKMLSFDFQMTNGKHHDAFYKDKMDNYHVNNCVMCWIKHFFNLRGADLNE